MNVAQLIEELQKHPRNRHVFVEEMKTEFAYGLINSARSQEIKFQEEPGGKSLATDTVVILSED